MNIERIQVKSKVSSVWFRKKFEKFFGSIYKYNIKFLAEKIVVAVAVKLKLNWKKI